MLFEYHRKTCKWLFRYSLSTSLRSACLFVCYLAFSRASERSRGALKKCPEKGTRKNVVSMSGEWLDNGFKMRTSHWKCSLLVSLSTFQRFELPTLSRRAHSRSARQERSVFPPLSHIIISPCCSLTSFNKLISVCSVLTCPNPRRVSSSFKWNRSRVARRQCERKV